jgi:hypothetical protein
MATRSGVTPTSIVGAARTGMRRWASKRWGWFVPILAVISFGRGGKRTVRWTWRGARGAWRIPGRIRRRIAEVLEHRGQVECAYCGQWIAEAKAGAHAAAHNQEAQREMDQLAKDIADAPRIRLVHPEPRRPAPKPAPAPAAPAASPTPPAAPASSTVTSNPGGNMATTGTAETQQLIRASNGIGEMDPQDAWELDAELSGLSRAALVLTENLGQYIETLDRIKVDPRVTAQAGVAVGQVAEVVRTFSQTRQLFRTLYAAQFAAAENGVRQVAKKDFFDPSRAA